MAKRLSSGIYEFQHKGATYEIEDWKDGTWLLFIIEHGRREYCKDFLTKRAAIAAVRTES